MNGKNTLGKHFCFFWGHPHAPQNGVCSFPAVVFDSFSSISVGLAWLTVTHACDTPGAVGPQHCNPCSHESEVTQPLPLHWPWRSSRTSWPHPVHSPGRPAGFDAATLLLFFCSTNCVTDQPALSPTLVARDLPWVRPIRLACRGRALHPLRAAGAAEMLPG